MKKAINQEDYKKIISMISVDDLENFKNYLLLNNLDINSNFSKTNSINDTLIYYCVKNNKQNFIKFLISLPELDLEKTNSNELTPLMHAIGNKKTDIFDLLMTHSNPGFHITKNDDMTALARASQAGNFHMVKQIVEHPSYVWNKADRGPLFFALSNKKTNIAQYLIHRPEFDSSTWSSCPLSDAIYNFNSKNILAILNLENFDPNAFSYKDPDDDSVKKPIWWKNLEFLSGGPHSLKVAKLILNHPKINLNAKDSNGDTLLDKSYWDHHVIADHLIVHPRFNIHYVDEKNLTILEKLCTESIKTTHLSKAIKSRVENLTQRILKDYPEEIPYYHERMLKLSCNDNVSYVMSCFSYYQLQNKIPKTIERNKKVKI